MSNAVTLGTILTVASLWAAPLAAQEEARMTQMKIVSKVFATQAAIPAKYSCDGQNINPPLEIDAVPRKAKSLALVMSDPDAPGGLWVHWVVWNIDPATKKIAEKRVPRGAVQGTNSWGKKGYGGPCPPSGTHRYFFRLYALSDKVELPPTSTARDLERAISGKTLATTEMFGTYSRKQLRVP